LINETLTNKSIMQEESKSELEPESEARLDVGTDIEEDGGEVDRQPEEKTIEERLTEAEEAAAEYLDGWQRARAEFANARKRLERERAEAYGSAAVDYTRKLLPILDDFDRALNTVPPTIEEDNWFEGLTLAQRKLRAFLEDLRVERIDAVGQPFDPNLHEALALKEADGVESGVVVEELQVGYRLGNTIIRPSLVNVAA
jgi:molecular chaperone GrpE